MLCKLSRASFFWNKVKAVGKKARVWQHFYQTLKCECYINHTSLLSPHLLSFLCPLVHDAHNMVLKGRAKEMGLRNRLPEAVSWHQPSWWVCLLPFSKICCVHFSFVHAGSGGQKGFSGHIFTMCVLSVWQFAGSWIGAASISSLASDPLLASHTACAASHKFCLRRLRRHFCYGSGTEEMAENIWPQCGSQERRRTLFFFLYCCPP